VFRKIDKEEMPFLVGKIWNLIVANREDIRIKKCESGDL